MSDICRVVSWPLAYSRNRVACVRGHPAPSLKGIYTPPQVGAMSQIELHTPCQRKITRRRFQHTALVKTCANEARRLRSPRPREATRPSSRDPGKASGDPAGQTFGERLARPLPCGYAAMLQYCYRRASRGPWALWLVKPIMKLSCHAPNRKPPLQNTSHRLAHDDVGNFQSCELILNDAEARLLAGRCCFALTTFQDPLQGNAPSAAGRDGTPLQTMS